MPENKKIRVILITDGDKVAQKVIENVAQSLNLRCISASGGNPTPISGEEIVQLLKEVSHDPVLVMFDDRGKCGKYQGEWALEVVAGHPDIEVLGAVAVASNAGNIEGVEADACIDSQGHMFNNASVNKKGDIQRKPDGKPVISGDTVGVLNEIKPQIPVIIGIGDIGKMDKADDIKRGCPITRQAIEEILKRSGIVYGQPE